MTTDAQPPTTQATKRGRPPKYASNAERQRAYRQRWAVVNARISPETIDHIDEIAQQFEVDRGEVVRQLVMFSLMNRNWKGLGLTGWKVRQKEIK